MSLFAKKPHVPNEAVKQISVLLLISKGKAKKMLLDGKYGAASVANVNIGTMPVSQKMQTADKNGNLTAFGRAVLNANVKLGINSAPAVLVLRDDAKNVKGVVGLSYVSVPEVKAKRVYSFPPEVASWLFNFSTN